jgi:hypothetical protein
MTKIKKTSNGAAKAAPLQNQCRAYGALTSAAKAEDFRASYHARLKRPLKKSLNASCAVG